MDELTLKQSHSISEAYHRRGNPVVFLLPAELPEAGASLLLRLQFPVTAARSLDNQPDEGQTRTAFVKLSPQRPSARPPFSRVY